MAAWQAALPARHKLSGESSWSGQAQAGYAHCISSVSSEYTFCMEGTSPPPFFFLWLVQIFLSSCLRNLVADCTAEEDFDSFANIFCPSFGEVQRTACLGLQTFPLLKSATLLTQTCHQKQAFISIICSIILKILVVAVNVFSPGISKSNYFLLYD